MSEPDVYDYLKKVHSFLIEFSEFELNSMLYQEVSTQTEVWISRWKSHISDLINELFTVFLYGNLLSAAAMTRTLIECFVYFSILSREGNEFLIHEWYLCSLCHSLRGNDERTKELVKEYCSTNNLDFDEKWDAYKDNKNANKWLSPIISAKKLNFKEACDYLGEEHIHKDFESACAFVHGQDIISKVLPFTFYEPICYRFHMMMTYVYRTISLFPLSESLENQVEALSNELMDLAEKYCQ